jgi:hypothetical protein
VVTAVIEDEQVAKNDIDGRAQPGCGDGFLPAQE